MLAFQILKGLAESNNLILEKVGKKYELCDNLKGMTYECTTLKEVYVILLSEYDLDVFNNTK